MSLDSITMLRHGKVELALHHLRDATATGGRPLLVLHGLGESAPRSAPRWTDGWPGPVAALDFTGHGASTIPRGGGYTAELLLGDADAALNSLTGGDPTRSITVVGSRGQAPASTTPCSNFSKRSRISCGSLSGSDSPGGINVVAASD